MNQRPIPAGSAVLVLVEGQATGSPRALRENEVLRRSMTPGETPAQVSPNAGSVTFATVPDRDISDAGGTCPVRGPLALSATQPLSSPSFSRVYSEHPAVHVRGCAQRAGSPLADGADKDHRAGVSRDHRMRRGVVIGQRPLSCAGEVTAWHLHGLGWHEPEVGCGQRQ